MTHDYQNDEWFPIYIDQSLGYTVEIISGNCQKYYFYKVTKI